MRYFLTKGLILKKQSSGENDWYVTIFSPEYGKIQAVSRSSRKISSQKGTHLDPLNLCQFQLYRNGNRLLITEGKVENAHLAIKSDLPKTLISFTILELLLKSLQPDQPNSGLFQLTLQTLEKLSSSSADYHLNQDLILEEYKIKLLKEAGSWPDLSLCYFCQRKWTNQEAISYDREGHLTCLDCHKNNHNPQAPIPFNSVKLAKYLGEENIQGKKLRLNQEDLFNLKKITDIFLKNYLHQEIHSEKIFPT